MTKGEELLCKSPRSPKGSLWEKRGAIQRAIYGLVRSSRFLAANIFNMFSVLSVSLWQQFYRHTRKHPSPVQHAAKDPFPGHNAVTGQGLDGTGGVTLLSNLGYLQQNLIINL